ncbi:hypothetical protein [Bifidobacterium cuniculi]|uniref:Uncharacterized protein n=1 Tax=Bifidobacterium cuniculi TaxID=1688 RepID=A0A087AYQ4_9BIFI|nr:hypothetical protein [Bifidobacterium cuniculi]KFI63904.1 hypothetical protein BCUN_1516 [Bifidobacterium cuniculi]
MTDRMDIDFDEASKAIQPLSEVSSKVKTGRGADWDGDLRGTGTDLEARMDARMNAFVKSFNQSRTNLAASLKAYMEAAELALKDLQEGEEEQQDLIQAVSRSVAGVRTILQSESQWDRDNYVVPAAKTVQGGGAGAPSSSGGGAGSSGGMH